MSILISRRSCRPETETPARVLELHHRYAEVEEDSVDFSDAFGMCQLFHILKISPFSISPCCLLVCRPPSLSASSSLSIPMRRPSLPIIFKISSEWPPSPTVASMYVPPFDRGKQSRSPPSKAPGDVPLSFTARKPQVFLLQRACLSLRGH